MADHHAVSHGHPAMDYAEHDRTFHLFMGMVKYVSVFVVVLLIVMAITLL